MAVCTQSYRDVLAPARVGLACLGARPVWPVSLPLRLAADRQQPEHGPANEPGLRVSLCLAGTCRLAPGPLVTVFNCHQSASSSRCDSVAGCRRHGPSRYRLLFKFCPRMPAGRSDRDSSRWLRGCWLGPAAAQQIFRQKGCCARCRTRSSRKKGTDREIFRFSFHKKLYFRFCYSRPCACRYMYSIQD